MELRENRVEILKKSKGSSGSLFLEVNRAFSVAAPSQWIALPAYIKTIVDKESFKKALKTHFLDVHLTADFVDNHQTGKSFRLLRFNFAAIFFHVKRP